MTGRSKFGGLPIDERISREVIKLAVTGRCPECDPVEFGMTIMASTQAAPEGQLWSQMKEQDAVQEQAVH